MIFAIEDYYHYIGGGKGGVKCEQLLYLHWRECRVSTLLPVSCNILPVLNIID